MANLIGGDGERSRAQMILIIGFALAVVFVALAFLLNSVIFTENLATRSESTRTSHAISVTGDMNTGMAAIIEYANDHNTTSYTTLDDELVDGNRSMERLTNRQQLTSGALVNVTYLSHTRGTWINQSYEERNFTDDNVNQDWTLFSGANGARAFRIHVTDPSKLEDTDSTNIAGLRNFTVVASDGTDTWEMQVYHDFDDVVSEVTGSSPYVVETIDGDGDTRYCSVSSSASSFWINVSEGTVAGEDCRALQFGEDIGDVDTVEFRNGDNAYGTYRLMASKERSAVLTGPYNTTGTTPPIRTPAIFHATIHVEYQTRTLTFETDVSVKPEEHDV